MSILERIRAAFTPPPTARQIALARYEHARQECADAHRVYAAKCDRGDDRGAGETWRPYHLARCRMMRAEVELRGVK